MTKLNIMAKGLLGASVLTFFSAGTAFAGGTAAGTNVGNTFTLDYKVGGVDQPTIDTGPGGSDTPTEFTVDRLVDLTVTSVGDTNVAPGAVDEELVFSVTNNGNDVQAYDFTLFHGVDATDDDFDAGSLNITFYVDDGDGIFQTDGTDGAGTAYTPGSGTATDDLPADAIIWVVVDGDIGAAQVDGDTSEVSLVADTLEPSTAGVTAGDEVLADAGGNTLTGAAENVLGDGAGTTNEVDNAGDHSATGTYIVASADLTATKAVTIFSEDGSGCAIIPGTAGVGDQYSIPGACVQYVITVTNNGATAAATNIDIADVLPTDLTHIGAVASVDFTGGPSFSQPTSPTDCGVSVCAISLTGATLAAGDTGTITIRALIK